MSTPINSGGPAFPCETYGHRNGKETTIPTNGMSLRQHFAGLAMAALLSREDTHIYGSAELARLAYQQADAMIAAEEAK